MPISSSFPSLNFVETPSYVDYIFNGDASRDPDAIVSVQSYFSVTVCTLKYTALFPDRRRQWPEPIFRSNSIRRRGGSARFSFSRNPKRRYSSSMLDQLPGVS